MTPRVRSIKPTDIKTQRRITCLLIGVGVLFLCLGFRLFWWQVIQSEWLQQKAEDQWTRDLAISPLRGVIYDTNGEVLAQSVACETVVLRPRSIVNADQMADDLSVILDMDRSYILSRAENNNVVFERVLKRQVTREQADAIRKLDYAGVALVPDRIRVYTGNSLLGRVLGYTNIDGAGQDGLELYYDKYLTGEPGSIRQETSITGEELPYSVEEYIPPVDGLNAVLTIDNTIQHFAKQAVDEAAQQYNPAYAGCMIMDVNTGAIRGLAVSPSMDLNDVPRSDLTLLRQLSRNPMVQDNYDPGSTFKIITTAAALESGAVNLTEHFNCGGGRTVLGTAIHCWKRTGAHGSQTIKDAVRNSCNPVFMDLALRMGKQTFYDYLEKFGFGRVTGVDYPGEAKGIITPVQYVTDVDLACIGFGQSISVTPLQLISAVSTVVNGGYQVTPHFVAELTDAQGNVVESFTPARGEQILSEQTSATMRDILEYTVREGIKGAYVEGYRVGGKTGTSQKFENGSLVQGVHVSSFIGFAPADDPQFAVLFIVDEPQTAVDYGSVVAAPYAGEVMGKILEYLKLPKNPLPGESQLLQKVIVPDVTGKTVEEAQAALEQAGLDCWNTGTGTVTLQYPAAGEEVYTQTTVRLVTSEAYPEDAEQVVVPQLTGLSMAEAYTKLCQLGLQMKVYGAGVVTEQSIAAGQTVTVGETITLQLSIPPASTATPAPEGE